MNPKEEFKKAQQDYKQAIKSIQKLNAQYEREHERLMRDMVDGTTAFPSFNKLTKSMRPTKEALKKAEKDRRDASHKLYEKLSKDFRKSNQTIQENRGTKSKEELLEELSDLNADSLIDFTEEEAADWESKYGMINPAGQSKKGPQNP